MRNLFRVKKKQKILIYLKKLPKVNNRPHTYVGDNSPNLVTRAAKLRQWSRAVACEK
jgi:hypothetical protein